MYITIALPIFAVVIFFVEHLMRIHRPASVRPSVAIMSMAVKLRRAFVALGSFLARITDVYGALVGMCRALWRWICRVWEFIQRFIPFHQLWRTLSDLTWAIWNLCTAPFWTAKSYIETFSRLRYGPISLAMLAIAVIWCWIFWEMARDAAVASIGSMGIATALAVTGVVAFGAFLASVEVFYRPDPPGVPAPALPNVGN